MGKVILFLTIFFYTTIQLLAQWVPNDSAKYTWTSPSADKSTKIKVAGSYVYVTGYSNDVPNSNKWAIVTIKYDLNLAQKWAAVYSPTGFEILTGGYESIDIDNSGNVYVSGTSFDGTNESYIVLKYDSSGNLQSGWPVTYNAGGNSESYAIAIDNNGYIYVTGGSDSASGGHMYMTTVKYNSSGSQQWVKYYPGHGFINSKGLAIALDNNTSHHGGGGVYVGGWADDGKECLDTTYNKDSLCHNDAQVVHYKFDGTSEDSVNFPQHYWGDEVHYGCGDTAGNDWANAIAIASNGDVYAVGSKWCNENHITRMSHELFTFWSYWENDPYVIGKYHFELNVDLDPNTHETYCDNARYFYTNGGENIGMSLVLDENDYAYSTGYSMGKDRSGNPTVYDYVTMKLDHFGVKLWVKRYNAGTTNNFYATSIIKCKGKIYVTGQGGDLGSSNIVTIQYDTADGTQNCVANYTGTTSNGDRGTSIATDGNHIFVTGTTNEIGNSSDSSDYVVLRYDPCSGGSDNKNSSLNRSFLGQIPVEFSLSQNYPNPFNPTTRIDYAIPVPSFVKLEIYNILGQVVKSLPEKLTDPGYYSETIDGSKLASGIYFYTIDVKNSTSYSEIFRTTKKMLLIK